MCIHTIRTHASNQPIRSSADGPEVGQEGPPGEGEVHHDDEGIGGGGALLLLLAAAALEEGVGAEGDAGVLWSWCIDV